MPTHAFPIWSVLPFISILLSIAFFPLIASHWWEHNRNKAFLVLAVSVPMAIYLLTVDRHGLLHSLHEYVSFIALLAALYTVSGGFCLKGEIPCTPAANTALLAVGAVLANLVGTTGASMLLIRPLLHANAKRDHKVHVVLFFILLVSNVGGCLTPLGDPPLFLGFLRGVPFFWTLKLFPYWAVAVLYLLGLFYLVDCRFYAREPRREHPPSDEPLRLMGKRNLWMIGGVVVAVFWPSPWREIAMVTFAALSYRFSPKTAHESNRFNFIAIQEVAILFLGIFVTMVPALALLHERAPQMGLNHPWQYFWITGGLSSLLDNAPTYLTFFTVAHALPAPVGIPLVAGVAENLLVAISVGAVFMGANTYIGNGPNFMVKSIAERYHVKLPHFFGYMAWALVILMPLYAALTLRWLAWG